MTNTQEIPVLVFAGFMLQWLRGFRWFNDGATLLAALVLGGVAALLAVEPVQLKPIIMRAFELVPTVLGGTLVGHMAAQAGPFAPKFNSFGKPPEEEAPK